jgi:hypothetical protein
MRHRKHRLHHPSTSPISLRLERWHRYSIYGACSWLLATGVLWLVAHYLLRAAAAFGESVSPLEPWSMKLHGAGAMVALFFIGSLLNNHIRRELRARRNLASGWAMIAVLAALTLSGYGLYYVAGEESRPLWSTTHWIIGLGFAVLIVLHIVLGRKAVGGPK